MRRDRVAYRGEQIVLPELTLIGGGWVEWELTWRVADGGLVHVDDLEVLASGGVPAVERLSKRIFRIHITPIDSGDVRLQGRARRGEFKHVVCSQIVRTQP